MWPEYEKTVRLLDEAREGVSDAVNQLFACHRNAIWRLVQMRLDKRIQKRVGVSDVVQDVLVEANRRLDVYLADPQLPFHLWLRQISRDRIIDAHRRHRVSAKRSIDREHGGHIQASADQSSLAVVDQLVDGQLTPAAIVARKELAERVELVIAGLPDQDREILMLRHYQLLTNQEVAEALELTPPASGMRYLRAVRHLQAILLSEHEQESP